MMEAPYRQPTSLEEIRTLWIGELPRGVDEKFLDVCFAHTGAVQSVRLVRNRTTKLPEGYGFIEFISHEAAEKVLQTYNGKQMPGTEHIFRLNWASLSCGERHPHEGPNHLNGPYPTTRPRCISAGIPNTSTGSRLQDGASKGKEAVVPYLGKINRKIICDADERRPDAGPNQSNGGYCSTSPMRISAAIPKASSGSKLQNGGAKATYPAAAYTIPQAQTVPPDSDLTNTTLSIGNLDPNATEEELRQICVRFGELIDVKILVGKGCGFVQYASRVSAEEAVQRLHGTVIGQQVVIPSWGRSPANQQVQRATSMASAVGSHVPGLEQNKVYDPVNLHDIHKGANVVTGPNTGIYEGYGFMKFVSENEKISAVTEMNGSYLSTRPMQIGAPKTSSRSQLQDGAAKDSLLMAKLPVIVGALSCPVVDPVSPPWHSAELVEIKVGTFECPINNLISFPLKIGSVSVHPTVLVEKKKKKWKKKKKRTGSAPPTTDASSATDSSSTAVGSSAPPWGECLPVWSVPWSGLPCGCPWPVSALDALNVQPTAQYGLHEPLPDEPNEILASFKPWMQRYYGYGGMLPCPRDLVSLEAFKEKCPLSEPYVLHNGKEIRVTSSSGRFVVDGLLDDIISTFKSGYSWGGKFCKDDLAVQVGVRCYVSKAPNLPGTYNNLCKDLDQLADSAISYFEGEHENEIAFIKHLCKTLKNPPPPSSTRKKKEGYLKFLKSHPARADPLSASSLLVGIVQTFKSMGLSDKKAYKLALSKIDFEEFREWIEKVESDPLWSKVYHAKRQKAIKKKRKNRYPRTAIGLSTFLRHFVIHSPEYSLVEGVQRMKTIDEVDYLVADFFGNFVADLFKVLLEEFDMDKHFLKSVWKLYNVGEDRKEAIKRIWKCEAELDFMLDLHEDSFELPRRDSSRDGGVEMGMHQPDASDNLKGFLKKVDGIESLIAKLTNLLTKLQSANEESKAVTKASAMKGMKQRMKKYIDEVGKIARMAKAKVDELEKDNLSNRQKPECGKGSAVDRSREQTTGAVKKKLKERMDDFQVLRESIWQEFREVVERRVFTVTGNRPDEETINDLIETGRSEQIFKDAVQQQGRDQILDTVAEIQERRDAIRYLERKLLELQQIFLDMAVLVDAQGDMINHVETHVSNATNHIQQGVGVLQNAKKLQRNSRKWMCHAIILLLVVVVIIVVAVIQPWKK